MNMVREDNQAVDTQFEVEFTSKDKLSVEKLAEKMSAFLNVEINTDSKESIGTGNWFDGVCLRPDGYYGKPNEFTLSCADGSTSFSAVSKFLESNKNILTTAITRFYWDAPYDNSEVSIAQLIHGINLPEFTEQFVDGTTHVISKMIKYYDKTRSRVGLFKKTITAINEAASNVEYDLEVGVDSIAYDGFTALWVIGNTPSDTLLKLANKAKTGTIASTHSTIPDPALGKWFATVYATVTKEPAFQAFCDYIATGKADEVQTPVNSPEELSESIERIKYLTKYLKG